MLLAACDTTKATQTFGEVIVRGPQPTIVVERTPSLHFDAAPEIGTPLVVEPCVEHDVEVPEGRVEASTALDDRFAWDAYQAQPNANAEAVRLLTAAGYDFGDTRLPAVAAEYCGATVAETNLRIRCRP